MKYACSVEIELDDLIPLAVVALFGISVAGLFVVAAVVLA
jgi:hypothetical protein